MKRLSMLAVLFACTRVTFAEPAAGKPALAPSPSPEARSAEAVVQRELVGPLAARERDQSKFSRARLPATARRIRVLDERPETDARGGAFYAFAVDERHGLQALGANEAGWRLGAVTGCVYLDKGEVFVKVGDRHRPAAFLLGKNLKPVAEPICQAAPAAAANP